MKQCRWGTRGLSGEIGLCPDLVEGSGLYCARHYGGVDTLAMFSGESRPWYPPQPPPLPPSVPVAIVYIYDRSQAAQWFTKLQDNCCGICAKRDNPRTQKPTLVLDHDHDTGLVRGLICFSCNTRLGAYYDNAFRLRQAGFTRHADYLEHHWSLFDKVYVTGEVAA